MKGYNLLWITLIVLSMEYLRKADSFQCYECENCPVIGENEMNYLKECGLPPSHTTRAPSTTTTTVASEEEEETTENEEEETEEEEEEVPSTTSTSSTSTTLLTSTSTPEPTPTDRPTSTISSTSMSSSTSTSSSTSQNTTQEIEGHTSESNEDQTSQSSVENITSQEQKKGDTWSLFPHSIEEDELINSRPEDTDLSEQVISRKARQLPGTRPVCYVLKLKYDGFEVTNRGCGPAVADKNLTCKMLAKGQPWVQCDLCEGNLCNGAARLKSAVIGVLYVLGLIALNSW